MNVEPEIRESVRERKGGMSYIEEMCLTSHIRLSDRRGDQGETAEKVMSAG